LDDNFDNHQNGKTVEKNSFEKQKKAWVWKLNWLSQPKQWLLASLKKVIQIFWDGWLWKALADKEFINQSALKLLL